VVSGAAGVFVGAAITHRYVMERRQQFFGQMRERAGDRAKGFQHRKQELLARLAQKLDLTADQKEKIKGILESSRGEISGVRQDVVAKLRAVRDKTDQEIQTVLTADQKEKYKKIMDNLKQRRGLGKGFRGGPERPEPHDIGGPEGPEPLE
jgi:Spy/CpxP family protein refolding chaperone